MKNDLTTGHVGRIALIILAVLIGGVVGFVYGSGQGAANYAEDNTTVNITSVTKSTAKTTASPTASASAASTLTKLSNTSYGYSFSYPSSMSVSGTTGQENQSAAPTTASGVTVFPSGVTQVSSNRIFQVALYTFGLNSAADITDHLGSNGTVTEATVAGKSGYKYVNTGDEGVFYFVKNTAGDALQIFVKNNISAAQSMYLTLQITP